MTIVMISSMNMENKCHLYNYSRSLVICVIRVICESTCLLANYLLSVCCPLNEAAVLIVGSSFVCLRRLLTRELYPAVGSGEAPPSQAGLLEAPMYRIRSTWIRYTHGRQQTRRSDTNARSILTICDVICERILLSERFKYS